MTSSFYNIANPQSCNSNKCNDSLILSKIGGNDVHRKAPGRYSTNDLDKAVQEGIAGTSTAELSTKYNIPRTTIYDNKRRTIMMTHSKDLTTHKSDYKSNWNPICGDNILNTSPRFLGYRNYAANDLNKAVQESLAGTPTTKLSRKYNIPNATIRDNVSKIEKNFDFKKTNERTYSANDLEKAVEESLVGMSYSAASRKYNIPRTTISYNVKKNNSDFKKPSERTYSANDLERAVQESKAGTSTAELSRKFNIPGTTIRNNVKKASGQRMLRI